MFWCGGIVVEEGGGVEEGWVVRARKTDSLDKVHFQLPCTLAGIYSIWFAGRLIHI